MNVLYTLLPFRNKTENQLMLVTLRIKLVDTIWPVFWELQIKYILEKKILHSGCASFIPNKDHLGFSKVIEKQI